MSGFFSGFTGGMEAGGRIAQRGMDNYEKRQKEESEGKMFKIATELGAEGNAMAEAGGQREEAINAFNNASVGDMTSMIMEKHIADGGKINDHSYKMAYGMANTMFGVRNMEQKYQNDKKFFNVKMRKGEAEIARLNAIAKNGGSVRGGAKDSKLMQNAKYITEKYGEDAGKKYIESNWNTKYDVNNGIDLDGDITETKKDSKSAPKTDWLGDTLKKI